MPIAKEGGRFAGLLEGTFRLDWQKNAIVWNATPLCIMWTTWEERNSHLFEGIEHSLLDLKFILLCTLYEWMAILSCDSYFTI